MGATWSCSLDPCPCKTTGDVGRCHCYGEGEWALDSKGLGFYVTCVRCKAPMSKQSPGVAVKSGLREGDRIEEPKK